MSIRSGRMHSKFYLDKIIAVLKAGDVLNVFDLHDCEQPASHQAAAISST